jgi:hypothetical protein
MSHSQTVEALILKTYNVGEADRYCVLLTKEKGRVAARANGVRKLTSRMGGSLTPFQPVRVELKESGAGWMITGVQPLRTAEEASSMTAFTLRAQGAELLLRLLQDEEEFPSIYQTTVAFFTACNQDIPHVLLAYTIRLLHLLGLLPDDDGILLTDDFLPGEAEFLQASRAGYFLREAVLENPDRVQRVVDRIVQGQLTSPLKAPGVANAMKETKSQRPEIR